MNVQYPIRTVASALIKARNIGLTSLLVVTTSLTACDGSSSDSPQNSSTNASDTLPSKSINFDTSEILAGEVTETLLAESLPTLSAPEKVQFPYDPADSDPKTITPTEVEIRNACVTRTYDLKSNPEKVLLHGVDGAITWPGALLQGGLYRDGTLRGLNISPGKRKPTTITIKNVFNNSGQSSSRTVDNPSLSTINDAVNDMIVTGYDDNLPLGGSVSYNYAETKDVSRFMLKAKASARYGIGSGSLSTGINKSASYHTIIVNLVQKLFDIEVQEPPSQDDWFKPEFYAGELQDKTQKGEISDVNPPVYLSKITYGRTLTYTMTSTATGSQLNAMVKASVKTLAASGSLQLNAKQQSIQDNLSISMVSIGGNQATALIAAQTGDWATYFEEDLKLTTAAPISVEFKNIYDNSPAGTTEAGTYNEEICTPQIVVPGPYDFALEDAHTRPAGIKNLQQVVSGDFNGDGLTDIVWNHLLGNENQFYVGYGSATGRFDILEKACAGEICDFSERTIPWGQFELLTGDFVGNDGRDDLLWLQKDFTNNQLQIYLTKATDSGFEKRVTLHTEDMSLHMSPESGAAVNISNLQGKIIIEDMNNTGRDDLVLWYMFRSGITTVQEFQIIRSVDNDANLFSFEPAQAGIRNTDLSYPDTPLYFLATDINSDGWNDLIWGLLGRQTSTAQTSDYWNATHWRTNNADNSTSSTNFSTPFTFNYPQQRGWSNYTSLYGDFNGDGFIDISWVRVRNGSIGAVHQAAFDASGQQYLQQSPQQWKKAGVSEVLQNNVSAFVIDANGDSALDIVANKYLTAQGQINATNSIAVMKGIKDGNPSMFNTSATAQTHPINQDWQNYTHVFVGDVNGDGLQDMIWNNAALDNSIYVAFAKLDKNN